MPNTSAFPPDPALAYPHFNTYRLAPQALQTTSFPLPADHHAGFPSLEAGRVIGWKEAKARAIFEVLKCGTKPDQVVFVDNEGKVVSVEFKQQAEGITPTYTTLASLVLPISTASAVDNAQTPEYPSVLAVRGTQWLLASAGDGRVCVIRSSGSNAQGGDGPEERGAVVAEYVVAWPRSAGVGTGSVAEGEMEQDQEDQGEEYPFLLQAVVPVYDTSAESPPAEPIGCRCVVSRTLRIEALAPASTTSTTSPIGGPGVTKKHDVQFQLAGVFIPFPSSHGAMTATTNGRLGVEWCAQAGEAASYVRWVTSDVPPGREGVGNGRWLIGGNERFRPFPPLAVASSSAAMENIPGQQQHHAQEAGEDRSVKQREEPRAAEYPFSWTQTKDSVTVTFDLAFRPSSTTTTTATTTFDPNRDMILHLTPHSLDLRFPFRPEGNEAHFTPSQRMFFGVLEAQQGRRDWWDAIDKEGSTWLFEWVSREEGRGRVVIELVKRNEGVKWASVFAPLQRTGTADALDGYDNANDDDDEGDGMTMEEMDIDVPETMTQEQLDASRAGLEQWHATVAEINNSNDGLNRYAGLGSQQMSSLMREQMEDEDLVEFDDDPAFSGHVGGEPIISGGGGRGAAGAGEQGGKVGTSMVFTSVSSPRGEKSGWNVVGPAVADEQPVWVLSTEITNDAGPSVILKSHVDGQLFVPPRSLTGSWTHRSTNPALSFVLASKRDTQYVHHLHPSTTTTTTMTTESDDPGATVIAFEARQPNGMGGNAYVYWPVGVNGPGEKTKSGKNAATEGRQSVVKFGEAGAGPLLGISSVVVEGQIVVVGLCERQLVVLQGL